MSEQARFAEVVSIRNVLVPLDGSRLAEAAVTPAISIARACGSVVTLLHVLERDAPTTVHGERHLMAEAEASAYLADVAGKFEAKGVAVRSIVQADWQREPSTGIVTASETLNADLIVLASHGAGGIRDFLFGRVARQVVRHGTRPVLLIQVRSVADTAEQVSFSTIALSLNGSREAEAAVPVALAIARAFDATLHLISVIPTLGTLNAERAASATLLPGTARAVMDLEEASADDYLLRAVGDLRARGFDATAGVVRGDPAEAVLREVDRVDAGLLALATHGRQGLSGIWSGSVSAKILDRYHGPLLLVRIPD